MEELIKGEKLRDFYKSFRSGDIVYIAQRRVNSHEKFLELSEYGVGERRSFIVIPRTVKEDGGGDCVAEMRKVVNFLEPHGNVGSKEEKIHGSFLSLLWLVEIGRCLYVEVVVGKGHDQKIVYRTLRYLKSSPGKSVVF